MKKISRSLVGFVGMFAFSLPPVNASSASEEKLSEILREGKKPPTLLTTESREKFLKDIQTHQSKLYFHDGSSYWEIIAQENWQKAMMSVAEDKLVALFGFEEESNMAVYCLESDKENPIFGLEWIGATLPQ